MLLEAADRAGKGSLFRDDIGCISAVERAYRDHRSIGWIDISGHDALQRDNQLTGDVCCVDSVMGRGAVAALAMHCKREHIGRCPQWAGLDDYLIVG